MKGGTQTALALGVGYLLGRRRKMRLATMLAAAAATRGVGTLGGMALQRGMKMLGSTEALGKFAPQLGELADTVRSDLVDAGKAAASAAVSSRIESLTDSLHERAELIRDPGAAAGEAGQAARSGAGKAAGAARSGAGGAARRLRRRGQEAAAGADGDEPTGEQESYPGEPEDPEDYGPEDGESEPGEPEDGEPEPGEPRVARRRTGTGRRPAEREAPVRRGAATRRRAATGRRSPVVRAGR